MFTVAKDSTNTIIMGTYPNGERIKLPIIDAWIDSHSGQIFYEVDIPTLQDLPNLPEEPYKDTNNGK